MKEDNLQALGELLDTIDSIKHALNMPVPDLIHVEAMRGILPDLTNAIKEVYFDEGGEDVWNDKPENSTA